MEYIRRRHKRPLNPDNNNKNFLFFYVSVQHDCLTVRYIINIIVRNLNQLYVYKGVPACPMSYQPRLPELYMCVVQDVLPGCQSVYVHRQLCNMALCEHPTFKEVILYPY